MNKKIDIAGKIYLGFTGLILVLFLLFVSGFFTLMPTLMIFFAGILVFIPLWAVFTIVMTFGSFRSPIDEINPWIVWTYRIATIPACIVLYFVFVIYFNVKP